MRVTEALSSVPAPEEGRLSAAEECFERIRRRAGLVLGPALFVLLLLVPPVLTHWGPF